MNNWALDAHDGKFTIKGKSTNGKMRTRERHEEFRSLDGSFSVSFPNVFRGRAEYVCIYGYGKLFAVCSRRTLVRFDVSRLITRP